MGTQIKEAAIQWLDWGQDAFERARNEEKLILLDSGASWCHWCHVMDNVTYQDKEVVEVINEKYVPVRIDRDRLSEVDAMLQRSPSLVGGQEVGGWPLTAVLTPEGNLLYKATFLPPRADANFGMSTGLIEILLQIDSYWRDHREEINMAAQQLQRATDETQRRMFEQPGELSTELIDRIASGIKQTYESQFGGFGRSPKFYNAAALELIMRQAWAGDDEAREMIETSLENIACGGVYDQIGGGFHRYSVDEKWVLPHFEKMAYDNAAMLAVFANAYAMTGREDFGRVAAETIEWIASTLGGRGDSVGFHASQDADTDADDDGDYFTWTLNEIRSAAGEDAGPLIAYYNADAEGDVPNRPGRNVLHAPRGLEEVAAMLEMPIDRLASSVEAGRLKLRAARARRKAPTVDTTVFADVNGMLIDALITAWRRTGIEEARTMALTKLDRMLASMRDASGVFAHYVLDGNLESVGLLSDQAWMGRALVTAYTATGNGEYLASALQVAKHILGKLRADDGSFVSSTMRASQSPEYVPAVRSWDDAPVRSPSSVAACMLMDLSVLTGNLEFNEAGQRALESFAGGVDPNWGLFLGGYAMALDRLLEGPRTIWIVAPREDGATLELERAADRAFVPNVITMVLNTSAPTQKEIALRVAQKARDNPVAYICRRGGCLTPAHDADELRSRLKDLR
ncbi:MAG: thioredoxin domain-containing protein [Planctomycetes bacterium]|nr:thioredoxin domain-containing protein [Planctomycetota bacterium]